MNETYVRDRLRDMLKSYGFRVRVVTDGIKCPRCHKVIVPQSGRPDLKAIHPFSPPCFVEVKVIHSHENAFSLSDISKEQRAGLTERADQCYPCYIGLGVIRKRKTRDHLEGIYLVEWSNWLFVESLIVPHQNTIPLTAGRGFSKALQEGKLDITRQFHGWELCKAKQGWGIPVGHPAYTTLNLER